MVRPQDTGVFGSKTAVDMMPRVAQDTLYFTPTTFDYDKKSRVAVQSMKQTYNIGGRGCKYFPHPGARIMTVTDPGRLDRPLMSEKKAVDADLNAWVMKRHNHNRTAALGPAVDTEHSVYNDSFGVDISPKERRRAKRKTMNPDEAKGVFNGGASLELRSTAQSAFITGSPSMTGGFARPVDTLGVSEDAVFDTTTTTYHREHGMTFGDFSAPSAARVRGKTRAWARRRPAAENSLDHLLVGLRP
eukprot:CAMPEP_0206606154 /NCGR_PEP_ID=MMETSP0325_2-20121206/51054_1 /ASSEMBLY_ACC=CAM_ASM_000347 /TAXON_ID=2866 /ORGANISM="Crypthecodinium cohnii, Strain Seligo" /LENGTH=244 /DNA_ID=CAMNT_0054122259 /DNA_START=239 /DNA_END=970 /DNA_ORIENTATION=-